jgi:hypothetical protein
VSSELKINYIDRVLTVEWIAEKAGQVLAGKFKLT